MLARFRWLIILLVLVSVSSCDSYHKLENFKYNQNILLSGVVSSIPKLDDKDYKFVFHTYKYGDVLLKANKSYKHYLVPANELELEVKLYKPHEYDNTDAFNYSEYLKHNDIVAIGAVVQGSTISFKGTSTLHIPERIRYSLYNHLQNQLSSYKLKDYALALLIGDKNFDQSQQNLLISSGTSHLMVISGLHIGLLALIAFVIFRGVWSLSPRLCRKIPAQYIGVVFSLLSAFIYSLLAGFSLPTQRAVIMLLVVTILWLLGKRVSIIKALAFAFIIILLLDIESVYSASFWLSFSAVSILVVISVMLQQYKTKLVSVLLAQTYLVIFLIPISVYYFGTFSLVSILANIVAIPLVSFVIVPLLLFCLLVSFLGISLWFIPILFLKLLVAYLGLLTSYVNLVDYWSYFSLSSLLIMIFGIFLVIFPFNTSIRLLGLALCLVFFQSSQNLTKKYQLFNIHVFDTHNEMVLIQDNDKNLLYTATKNLTNEYVISNVLKSYLDLEGVKQIDYLIVVGSTSKLNLNYLRKNVSVKSIITNLSTNEKEKSCSYENNFSLTNKTSIKLLSTENNCYVSLKHKHQEILLMDNSKKNIQQKTYTLYNRIIKPNTIIAPILLDSRYFDLNFDYFVYISDKEPKLSNFDSLKIFDTYNNGAIDISIDKNDHQKISSQLKDY